MIGDSRPSSLAGAESSGAADLVTVAQTGPIYQLIWGVMHNHLGSREPGQNIAIVRSHGRWKGTTRQDCEQQGEGFRECDSERTNLTVSWMWHIKLNGGCEVRWSLGGDWWPSCSHSSSGSCHVKCSELSPGWHMAYYQTSPCACTVYTSTGLPLCLPAAVLIVKIRMLEQKKQMQ